MLVASALCLSSGLLRLVSTFPGLNDSLGKDAQYLITIAAQILVGLSNPLGFSLPTKVSLDWFPEREAPVASGLITMSFELGMIFATGLTPLIFSDEDLIQWMNVAYFVPSVASMIMCFVLVPTDRPPSAPTR